MLAMEAILAWPSVRTSVCSSWEKGPRCVLITHLTYSALLMHSFLDVNVCLERWAFQVTRSLIRSYGIQLTSSQTTTNTWASWISWGLSPQRVNNMWVVQCVAWNTKLAHVEHREQPQGHADTIFLNNTFIQLNSGKEGRFLSFVAKETNKQSTDLLLGCLICHPSRNTSA